MVVYILYDKASHFVAPKF